MQREAGLYGSIRVSLPEGESEPYAYDYDRSIILMIGSIEALLNKLLACPLFRFNGLESLR